MEEVLDLYAQPYDEKNPWVCLDELLKELHAEVRPGSPAAPGQPAKYDGEYKREGTANLFVVTCPLLGWRHIEVTERRTALDFAQQLKRLVDVDFPQAETIRVVLDNLNTHTKAALYEAFPAGEAKRLADKLEFVYTPKHASWLNMAELEWSVLVRQCLDRRIGDRATLCREVAAWEQARNAQRVKINWCFRVADARVKLSHLYPAKSL